jgi:hypothetical protein
MDEVPHSEWESPNDFTGLTLFPIMPMKPASIATLIIIRLLFLLCE